MHTSTHTSMEDMIPFNGLRGVCAMAIFLGHQTDIFLASPWPAARRQTVVIGIEYLQAVSIFFLLSGIPLARLYSVTGKLQMWRGTREFWRKRCARLVPIYYLALCLNLLTIMIVCEQVDMKAALQSFVGCALFLESWFISFINVGGPLWQVAVFAFGYLLFPFYSQRIREWSDAALCWGIIALWLFSAGLWCVFGAVMSSLVGMTQWGWLIWHLHCLSRLPHIVAGVLLGQLVDRQIKRHLDGSSGSDDGDDPSYAYWATVADALSVLFAFTAIQAPIVQWYYGLDVRMNISIGLEAWLLPLHALWLAGMVLAYRRTQCDRDAGSHSIGNRTCWTRHVLSFKPLCALGDISLVLYCVHYPILLVYTSTYTYWVTGDWRLKNTMDDLTFRVLAPWWHAPFQWAMVVAVPFAVSTWIEAPLRRMLSGSARECEGAGAPNTETESSALLSTNVNSVSVAYGVES